MGNINKRSSDDTGEGSWVVVNPPSSRRQPPRGQEAVQQQQQVEEQQARVESPKELKEQQPEKEDQGKKSTTEEEGAVALPLGSGKEEKLQKEEEPSPSQREGEQEESRPIDPALLAEISGFVYHEPDLVLHIRRSLRELQSIAKTIDSTKKNIRESTDDLVVTYNKTTNLFRQRSQHDETVENAIKKLEENVNIQDTVTEGFLSAADNIHSSVLKLNSLIDRMTSAVLAKIPDSMLGLDSSSSDTA